MVKVFKGLYINPLTVIFFVVCYLNGKTGFFLISYLSMICHELGHLTAALFIGLKPDRVCLHPFGVNLKLKSQITADLTDELVLYLSGPLVNLVLCLMFTTVFEGMYLYDYGFVLNVVLFAVNMLPISPLDGGCIFRRLLILILGERSGSLIMRAISFVLAVMVISLGIYMAYVTGYNFSWVFLGALMIFNVFSRRELYSETAIKNLICPSNASKNKKPVRIYVSDGEFVPSSYLDLVNPNTFTCVAVLDSSGKIERFVTERELIPTKGK